MRVDLTGRVALVVGEIGGLGRSVAALLGSNGALVVHETSGPEAADSGEPPQAVDMLVNLAAATPSGIGRSQAVAAGMAARGSGRIVQVASVAGIIPMRGREDVAAASAGVFARTRAMALDLARHGVLVNAIAMLGPDDDSPDILAHVPLRRIATAADVGNTILFLLAPASSYVTGHILTVDGGWSAGFARDF